ncbi:hypothetical protein [Flavivirga rizhaonensis]|uniref:Uncharacterized protein n=1 Tax=Flavivirga rizhaonensis TaxID=2559571 RepID=A0A4S1DSX4_9FLAO|nr:hypothetical protein [Flavivirga rizhaonensis]TGV01096.1 hypothetical protein EM932_16590 [Flavivirga rizhaonensis]
MKHIFKTLFIVTFLLGTIQSCSSNDETTQTISDEVKISPNLASYISLNALYKNDYNLINFDCENVLVAGGLLNSKGDYYGDVNFNTLSWNDELMSEVLEQAYIDTEIRFTKDDFSILYIAPSTFFGDIYLNRKDITKYFKDCSFEGDTKASPEIEPVKVSDINYNCSGTVKYYIDGLINSTSFIISLNKGINAVEEALLLYNKVNNSQFSLDNLRANYVTFTSPQGTSSRAIGKNQMVNYFDDCILDRPEQLNDCINFKYPFVFNKVNIQTEEIIPVTVTSDSELFQTFNPVDNHYLTIDYPLTLITLNGDEIIVTSNKELEDTLTNSADYCKNDEW